MDYRFEGDRPPSAEETEMARLLGLIDAEWRSDPSSVAAFDSRIVEGVRKSLASYKRRSDWANGEIRRHRSRIMVGRY